MIPSPHPAGRASHRPLHRQLPPAPPAAPPRLPLKGIPVEGALVHSPLGPRAPNLDTQKMTRDKVQLTEKNRIEHWLHNQGRV